MKIKKNMPRGPESRRGWKCSGAEEVETL